MKTVKLESPTVKVGDPMVIHFHVKNVSRKTQGMGDDDPDYEVIVTGAQGTEVPRTAFGKKMLLGFAISPRGVYLPPRGEGSDTIRDLAKIFQLTRPGQYFVRALWRGPFADSRDPRLKPNAGGSWDSQIIQQVPIEAAVSDPIPFTITP